MIVLVRCNCAFISNVRYSNLSPEISQGQSKAILDVIPVLFLRSVVRKSNFLFSLLIRSKPTMTWFLLSTKLKKQEQPLAFISKIFYDCQITTTSRDSKKCPWTSNARN